MHAGLLRPDSAPAPALAEAAQVAREIAQMPDAETAPAPVALIYDYASYWAWDTQPQGADFDYSRLLFEAYRACRALGLNVDILPPDTNDLAPYALVLLPGLTTLGGALSEALRVFDGVVLAGPRTNAKTLEMAIPVPLPPNLPGLNATVARVESLPPGAQVPLKGGGALVHWFEELEGRFETVLTTEHGWPALIRGDNLHYLAGWPDAAIFREILRPLCQRAGLDILNLPDGLRLRDTATHRFFFNYAPEPITFDGITLPPAGVHWQPL